MKADIEFFQKLSRVGDGESVPFITPDTQKYRHSMTLMSEVLTWSVGNIMDENFLKYKVQPIPVRFASLSKYLECFKNPFLEEVRAQLQQSLGGIKSSSYVSLTGVEEQDSRDDMDNYHLKRFLLLDHPIPPIADSAGKMELAWSPRSTDLILLSTVVPQTDYRELERSEVCYTFGLLEGRGKRGAGILSLVFAPSESPQYAALNNEMQQWYVAYVVNMAPTIRIWKALERSVSEMDILQQLNLPLLESLYTESTSERKSAAVDGGSLFVDESVLDLNPEIASYCRFRGLNTSQATAVTTVVHGLLQCQRPYIRLIQGPPGTGKTTTLATLFSILSCLRQRILICASTNVAVSEVALRFLQFFNVTNTKGKVVQYGQFLELSNMGIESSTLSSVTISDVVLIGNVDRLDVKGPLGQIYLDSRVDRLEHALSTITGWRASAKRLLVFLTSASSEFETYKRSKKVEKSGFDEFIRSNFTNLAADIEKNYSVLLEDLPSKMFTVRTKEIFQTLSIEITKFVELLTLNSLGEAFSSTIPQHFTDTGLEVLSAKDKLKVALSNFLGQLRNFYYPLEHSREWIQENCLKHARLVFSTVSSSGRPILLRSDPFQCVIVDEAAQCVEAETIIVTGMREVKQVVLVGDHLQLPATVISQTSQDCGYGRSLFERLQSLGHEVNLLNVQYRMHPAISLFPNKQFYNGKVEDGENVIHSREAPYQKQLFGYYKFINVHDGFEERDEDEGKSWKNRVEADVVVSIISKISTVCRHAGAENVSVGVITPYRSQVKELENMLNRRNIMPNVAVEVKSVDGFQGRETDVILFSCVRSNSSGHIGFLKDHRRLNVAITRAKYCLWIIGSERTLTSKDEVWKALISDAQERKCITNLGDHPTLLKLNRHVKELNQLGELLSPNSSLFNGTLWKVLLSKEMKTTISQVTSTATKQQFLIAMLNLANGRRSPYPTTTELASSKYRKLIQVLRVADFYMLWTVDVEYGPTPKQVIKVWDAVRQVDLTRLVRRLEGGFSTYTDIYLEYCAKEQYDTRFGSTKKFVIPAQWNWDASFVKFKSLQRKDKALAASEVEEIRVECPVLEKSAVDESILLMKFYPMSSGAARQLLTASDDSQLALPFEVNEQEAAIMQYKRSSFIIGRSGTGKTTVITSKLLQREKDFWLAMNSIADVDNNPDTACTSLRAPGFLKQVLITLSPRLCAAVKHYISKIHRSMQDTAGGIGGVSSDPYEDMMLDDEAEAKLMGSIPDSFANVPSNCYPLVITYRKFLKMLDGSVSEPFFPMIRQEPQGNFELRMNPGTTERSEVADLSGGHPSFHEVINSGGEHEDDFSDVDDENLSEVEDEDEDDSMSHNRDKRSRMRPSIRNFRVTEVDFERFGSVYWPHFNSKFSKNLDSSLVYTEIMSHIKGSVEALHSSVGFLSREDYKSMGTRRTSLYTEQQREDIYALFLQYEKTKRTNREYDSADLVTHLYSQLQGNNYLGEKIHFVYVDEVQDFTPAQIALFKFISDNLEDGFLFAGDTAQTIARGVGFRFEDIRRVFYEEFMGMNDQGASSVKELSKPGSMKVPDLFQLSTNFRTHMGIVGIADSVVQLLHHFFPQSIDKLDPESSLLQGEIPIFLKTQENHGLVTSLFDKGGVTGGGGCEFGAEQVILVRDGEAKKLLVKQLGPRGLVLTVHECKGLEFQDVLLHNIFTNSPSQNMWRVIYGFMETRNLLSHRKCAYPNFDVKRHNLLCNELKQLYVLLTRARQRLWIYDECVEYHQPMLDYWEASGLVHVKQLDASFFEALQSKSSPEDWRKCGIKMFNERHYDAAMLCFDRAGDSARSQHAKAAGLEQEAGKLQCINVEESARLLREAAGIFKSLQKGDAAANCYMKLKDFRNAAHAYFDVSMMKCVDTCWQGNLFDLGVSFIEKWEYGHRSSNSVKGTFSDSKAQDRDSQQFQTHQVADPRYKKLEFESIKFEFLKKAASYYHQRKNIIEMMKCVRMFPSLAMRRSFLKRRDYNEQLELIEEEAGNFEKAAELAECRGDLRRAAKLLEQSGLISLAVEKLLHVATMGVRWGNAEGRALAQQDLWNASALANQDNSGVGEALAHEIRILMHKIPTDNPDLCKLDTFKELWKQVKKLKLVRLELLSSHVLLLEIVGKIRRSFEEMEKSFVNGSVGEFSRVMREHLPDLVEVWNHWSKLMVLYVRAIERLRTGRGQDEDELILECVYLHLGVRKLSQLDSLFVENENMSWLEVQGGVLLRNDAKKRRSLLISEFSELGFEYFSKQIYAVGVGEVFLLLERVHKKLSSPALQTEDDSRLSKIDFIRILMFSFNILSTVSNVRTWEEESKLKMDTWIKQCAIHVYELFSLISPPETPEELQIIRELPDSSAVFERLAVDLMHTKPLTVESVGRLVTLHLYLGSEWVHGKSFNVVKLEKMDFDTSIFKDCLWNSTHWQHSATLKSTDGDWTTKDMRRCSFWSRNLVQYLYALRFVYREVNPNIPGYISPLVYLALLERGAVAACACMTHLKSMIISKSMALCYMGGKHHQPYYSMHLNCTCDAGCKGKDLAGILREAVKIIVEIFFEVLELKKWLHMSKMDPRMYLPLIILRLLKLLITICANTPSWLIHEHVFRSLRTLFEGKSPVLTEFPLQFFKAFEQAFINSNMKPMSIFSLVRVYSSALKSVGDQLVILRKTGRELAPFTCHARALEELNLIEVRVNQLHPLEFSLANLELNPSPGLDEANSQKRVTNAVTTNSNFGDHISKVQDRNRVESIKDTVQEDSHENESFSSTIEESSYSTCEDTTEDTWLPDTTNMSTLKSEVTLYPNISDTLRLEDGTSLSRKFVEQLQKLVQSARERIAVPLTPLESYRRQARSAFLRRGIIDHRYSNLFISEACFQVDAFERLAKLDKALKYIKSGQMKLDDGEELLDKFSDHKERLEEVLELLNPKARQHEDEDFNWLKKTIDNLRVLLQDGECLFQGHLKNLVTAAVEFVDPQSPHPDLTLEREGFQKSPAPRPRKGNKSQKKKKKNRR